MSLILSTSLVFVTQFFFLYLRAMNIKHTVNGQPWYAVGSNSLLAAAWLISTYFGVKSIEMITEQWPVLVAYFVGGGLGTFRGVMKKKENVNEKLKQQALGTIEELKNKGGLYDNRNLGQIRSRQGRSL